jgi:streptogramin lyase
MTSAPAPLVLRLAHRGFRLAGVACLAAAPLFAQGAGEIPPRLAELVLHASERPTRTVLLDGVRFDSIATSSSQPFLLWRSETSTTPRPAKDRDAVARWIARSAPALGHAGLEPRFAGTRDWRGGEVWIYQLFLDGVPVLDAQVQVHWDGAVLAGLLNELAGEIVSIERPAGALGTEREWVYFQRPVLGGRELALGWIEREERAEGVLTSVLDPQGVVLRRVAPRLPQPEHVQATFTEYPIPFGDFPDQIAPDSVGRLWFSQPNQNVISSFNPLTLQFRRYPTVGGIGPDGLTVDPFDSVWTGLFTSGGLGRLEISTKYFSALPAPYSPANLAIPFYSKSGRLWVTDHAQNRISELDLPANAWVGSYVMPTPNCWVVAATEDAQRQTLYFTEFNVSRLGKRPWSGTVQEINTPGGGVAFAVFSRDKVYYTEWNTDRLGVYDVLGGSIVEYGYPIPGEVGGPIGRLRGGRIAVGTRTLGYIMVFDPQSHTFTAHQIPTPNPGLKDGLTVDANDAIWFTEGNVKKIGKLTLP